jgi:hypothetical protein
MIGFKLETSDFDGSGVHGGERKYRFIKDDIAGNIDSTGGDIQAFESLMHVVISKKNVMNGVKL